MLNIQYLNRGFSLVEIVVSLAVFSIVMLVATGALLSIVEANKKAQSQQIAMNNLNFAVENMTRAIRVGTNYHCGFSGFSIPPTPQNCNGLDFFAFRPFCETQPCGVVQVYRKNGGVIERSTDGINYSAVTSSSIIIEELRFITLGATVNDGGFNHLYSLRFADTPEIRQEAG